MKTVRAVNQTSGSIVAAEVAVATSLWARFWGLMGKRSLPEGEGLLLKPCSSVHMFFMHFPLDIVFLDKSGLVTKVAPNLKPWRMALGGGGKQALEINAGAAAAAHVEVGDQIEFEPADVRRARE